MITGLVNWQTQDLTALDYSANPTLLSPERNSEKEWQFTEELRLASAKDAPLILGQNLKLKWQTGLFIFSQDYQQNVLYNLSSGFEPISSLPGTYQYLNQQENDLRDLGIGLNGQTTLTAWDKLDFTLGVRVDWERKEADLQSTTTIPTYDYSYSSPLSAAKDYSEVTPHFGVDYHITPEDSIYATATRGYKAGGFNRLRASGR